MSDLKNTNKRLKDANDRLVAENNRLEQELTAAERDLADKEKRLLDMDKVATVIAKPEEDRSPDFNSAPGKRTLATGRFDPEFKEEVTREGIRLTLDEKVFFASGSATLTAAGKAKLAKAGRTLGGTYKSNTIRVDGHTDNVPVRKVANKYPTNWELSSARACAVVRYLTEASRVPKSRIYAAGFADQKPVTTARTNSGRQKNRRVEIMILN